MFLKMVKWTADPPTDLTWPMPECRHTLPPRDTTGIAKVLVNKDTEELLGVHIIGLHAADLIQECANAMAAKTSVRELSYMVRASVRVAWLHRHNTMAWRLASERLSHITHTLIFKIKQVHTHPTLCEVLDEAFKGAVGRAAH